MRVERVAAVERDGLGGAKALTGKGVGPVVGEDAVLERETARGGQRGGVAGREQAQPELEVPEQTPLVGAGELRAKGELAGLAEVVQQGGGEQQVAVETGVQGAELESQSGDGDGMLEQPAEVGVVVCPPRPARSC